MIKIASNFLRKVLNAAQKANDIIVQRWLSFRTLNFNWNGGEATSRATVRITDGGRCDVETDLALSNGCKLILQGGALTFERSSFAEFGVFITCKQGVSVGDRSKIKYS